MSKKTKGRSAKTRLNIWTEKWFIGTFFHRTIYLFRFIYVMYALQCMISLMLYSVFQIKNRIEFIVGHSSDLEIDLQSAKKRYRILIRL